MTDTTLTKDHRIKAFNWLYGLAGDEGRERVSILEEYVSGLEEGIETLTAELERVEGEAARYREALEWYADHTIYEPAFANGGDDLDSHGMKSLAGIDSGNRARVALAALNGDTQ